MTYQEKPPSQDLQSFIRALYRAGCPNRRTLWWLLNRPFGTKPEEAYEAAQSIFTLDSIVRALMGQAGANRVTLALDAWSRGEGFGRSHVDVVRDAIPWSEIAATADAAWGRR